MRLKFSNSSAISVHGQVILESPPQRSWESVPFLNGEQPETVKDSMVALNDPGCVARAHPTATLSD